MPTLGAGSERVERCPALLDEARVVARTLTRALAGVGVTIVDRDLAEVTRSGRAPVSPEGAVADGCRAALTGATWQGMHQEPGDGRRLTVQTSPLRLVDGTIAGAVVVAREASPDERDSADLERRLRQQAAVAELGLRITEGLADSELDKVATCLCRDAMGADMTSLLEVLPGRRTAVLRAQTGWGSDAAGRVEVPLSPDRLAGYVMRAGGPLLVDDLANDPRFTSPVLVSRGMTCGIATPIGNPREPIGILGAHSRTPRRFNHHDVAFMQSVAGLLAGAAERRRGALLVEEAEARFRSAFRHAPIGMALFDIGARPGAPVLTQVNDALCAMLGYDADELTRIDPIELSHPDDFHIGIAEGMGLAAGRARTYSVEKRLLRADRSVMHARIRASLVHGPAGRPGHAICQVEDLTETTRLREEDDRLWELSADLLAIVGPSGFMRLSPSWERCLGRPAAEIMALPFEQLIHPEDQAASSDAFARAVDAPDVETHFECRVRTAREDWRWLAWNARCARRGPDEPVRVYCIARDVTDRRETERALFESLNLFDQSFENAPIGLAIGEAGSGRYLRVNDALCRLLGRTEEELLALESFMAVTHPDDREAGERALVDGLQDGDPFETEKRYLLPDGSSLWASVHVTPIRDADGSISSYFTQIIDIDARKTHQEQLQRQLDEIGWMQRIRAALDHDRFELHSQPIVDLGSGDTVQRELLIRMRDDDGGLVPPGLFLPAAEEHGLIEEIDRWVLARAVRIAAAGEAVEVNVSAASMSSPDFLAAVERQLEASGADPARLVFEITETALMRQMDLGVAFAERLAGLGCRFALDDFGTGYGSFTYLKRLPVHYLKIDREFVRELGSSPHDRHVVQAIVSLASGFEAQTIAEGVEDAETLELLRALGVDYAQGFHLGRPVPLG